MYECIITGKHTDLESSLHHKRSDYRSKDTEEPLNSRKRFGNEKTTTKRKYNTITQRKRTKSSMRSLSSTNRLLWRNKSRVGDMDLSQTQRNAIRYV